MVKTTSNNNCKEFVEAFIATDGDFEWTTNPNSTTGSMTNQTSGSDTLCKTLGNILAKLGEAGNCDPDLIPNCFLSGLKEGDIGKDLLKDVTLTLPSLSDLVAFEKGKLSELDASIDLIIPGTCYLGDCSVTLSFKINETTKTGGDLSGHILGPSGSISPSPTPTPTVTITAKTSASITGCTDFSNQIPDLPTGLPSGLGSTSLNKFICKNADYPTQSLPPCLEQYGSFGTAPESTAILADLDGIELTLKLVNGNPYIYLSYCSVKN